MIAHSQPAPSKPVPDGWRGVVAARDMRIALPGRALSVLGDSVTAAVLTLEVTSGGHPERVTGLLVAFGLPIFVLSGVAGRLVDRHDSRTLLVRGGLVQVVASAGLVWSPSYAWTLAFVMVLQCGQAVTGPTWAALLPRIVGERLVSAAVGLQYSLAAAAAMLGVALGGLLHDLVGTHLALVLDTMTFVLLVGVAFLVGTRRRGDVDGLPGAGQASEAAEASSPMSAGGADIVWQDPVLRAFVGALLLFIVAAEATNVAEPLLIVGVLGGSGTDYGLVGGAMGAGAVLGPLLAARFTDDRGRVGANAAATTTLALGLVAMGRVPSVGVLLPLAAAFGVLLGLSTALTFATVTSRTPDQARGRVLSAVNGWGRGASMLALLLGGALTGHLGARTAYLVLGLVAALVGPLLLLARRRIATAGLLEVANGTGCVGRPLGGCPGKRLA